MHLPERLHGSQCCTEIATQEFAQNRGKSLAGRHHAQMAERHSGITGHLISGRRQQMDRSVGRLKGDMRNPFEDFGGALYSSRPGATVVG